MKEKRTATLGLPKWIKEHRFLKAVPLESGEPSVALLLLWEADHHRHFPTTAEDIRGRMTAFTKSLSDAVAADTELSAWLTLQKKVMQLSPGLPAKAYLRWAVQIDPTVGEPFLGAWKAYLLSVARRHRAAEAAPELPACKRAKPAAPPSRKRPRPEGVPPPPSGSKKARLERLQAAQAAAAAATSSSALPASSSAPSGLAQPPLLSGGVAERQGRGVVT